MIERDDCVLVAMGKKYSRVLFVNLQYSHDGS